jgi:3-hydroxyisobutyrate dehydrogenase-like beta-hydroxyacid dehydrogenase
MAGVLMGAPVVCLIGFGEVGQTLAANLRERGVELRAWDVLFPDPQSVPSRALAGSGVDAAPSAAAAIAGSGIVISAVTAADCTTVARTAASVLEEGAFFLDLNSVSPATKAAAAAAIEAGRGRYVEAAVMSPINPKGVRSPMLLGGPHAAAFLSLGRELGFAGTEIASDTIGRASATKMCRSVMIKGIEALLAESLLAARHYGVEAAVLESLRGLLPAADWRTLAHYMIGRSLQHGRRRAAEMREVAITVREAGIDPWMSSAAAERQDWAAAHAAALGRPTLEDMLDAILANIPAANGANAC